MSRNSTEHTCRRPQAGGRIMAMLAAGILLGGCAGAPPREVAEPTAGEPAGPVYPEDAVDRYAAALGWLEAGEDAHAAPLFRALAADYPEYAGPLVNLAILEARAGRAAEAMALLQNAVAVCATCAPAWNELGVLLRGAGRFADAEGAYLQALQADPDYALAHYNLGVLYDLYQQQPVMALQHYERYLSLAGGENEALVDKWIADLRRRIGEPPRTAQAEDS